MATEQAEAVEIDGSVGPERRHGRSEHLAEHAPIVPGSRMRY